MLFSGENKDRYKIQRIPEEVLLSVYHRVMEYWWVSEKYLKALVEAKEQTKKSRMPFLNLILKLT